MPVSLTKAGTSTDAGARDGYDVDALRLLRFVHLRRVLRGLVAFELLAIPLWAAFSLSMEAVYDRGSTAWQKIDDETGPGFVVILVALVVTSALLVSVRWFGRTGRTAARLAPVWGGGPEPTLTSGRESARALFARLRRKGFVRVWLVALFLLCAALLVVAMLSFLPAWQGNHGHGGRVVTIGKDADVAYSKLVHGSRGHTHRDYFLGTPDGTALAETYHPRDGQRWTVAHDIFGNLRAYKVGGLDYLLMLLLIAVALLMTAGCVAAQVAFVKEELALRHRAGDADLAADVRALAGGGRARLTIPGGAKRKREDHTVVLGLRPLGGRDARRLLARRRAESITVATVVAGGLVALLVVQQLGLLNDPPGERDVTLPYLVSAGWDPEVTVFYDDEDSASAVLEDYAGPTAKGRIRAARDLVVDRATAPSGADGVAPSANVTVARSGSVAPAAVIDGFRSFRLSYRSDGDTVTEVAGLPSGWAGFYTRSGEADSYGRVQLVGAVRGTVVDLDIDDLYTDSSYETAHYTEAQIEGWARSLAAAIAAVGPERVAQDTVRPAHG